MQGEGTEEEAQPQNSSIQTNAPTVLPTDQSYDVIDDTHPSSNSSTTKCALFSTEAFRQQRLRAWQPILRPRKFIPFIFLLALIFVPFGALLIAAAANTFEVKLEYTNCQGDASNSTACELRFVIDQAVPGPVYLYYELQNYFQNHRLYVKSVNTDQLEGQALAYDSLSECFPLQGPPGFSGADRPVYYPCGLIANSLFNGTSYYDDAPILSCLLRAFLVDTFSPLIQLDGSGEAIVFERKDISWSYDASFYGKSSYDLDVAPKVYPPPFWQNKAGLQLNEDGSYRQLPDLSSDEPLFVWMRVGSLDAFRKLWGYYPGTLAAGRYLLPINSVFVVQPFDAQKFVVLTNNSFIGAKNYTLGIAFLVVGLFFFFMACLFLIRYLMKPRKLGDLSLLRR